MGEAEKKFEEYLEKYCRQFGLTLEEGKQEAMVRIIKEYYEKAT